ncbi:MAG: hypothetical protein QOD09_1277, partial [Bradyrhizobium sp.]|nr:hypothetical protein [Bradyrhizobium sp.]MEA2951213.1 hypothetical protein [Alphaproteobacteria bacterium]
MVTRLALRNPCRGKGPGPALLTTMTDAKLRQTANRVHGPREDFIVEIRSLSIPDLKLVVPQIQRDARGFFSETWSRKAMS